MSNQIKRYLKSKNIWYFKIWGGGYQTAGIPDIIACYNGKLIAIEVKSEVGKTTLLQELNLKHIKKCGGISIIARSLNDVKKVIENV